MIMTVKPMSVVHARALAMAYELRRLLGELGEEPGTATARPWNRPWTSWTD